MKIRIGADHPYMIFVSENWGEALKIALHSLPNFTF
jgi:predicted proteasome-type protease